ncbi:DUF4129 domain-containing protein [Natronolimnohabitans innermongolicus]|uniref:DUF4129 domain-containing protein n=1 Tax=Natronolimnohabitans innermongolicus TaxID=253107 RepID=UPI000A058490|nr:DUF4129 domain-containing protein [Natronolimnohabitans innermongolicus]
MSDPPSNESTPDASPDYRQLSFVAIAALAVVLAAFLAPVGGGSGITSPETGIDPSVDGEPDVDPDEIDADSMPDGDGEMDGFPDISLDWGELPEWFSFDWFGSDDPPEESEPTEPPLVSACTIMLHDDPTPGSEVTATVLHEREPVTGIPVQYNGEWVGETDGDGRVTGEVPYESELSVRLDTSDHPECEGVEDATDARTSLSSATAGVGAVVGAGTGIGAETAAGDSPALSADATVSGAGAVASTGTALAEPLLAASSSASNPSAHLSTAAASVQPSIGAQHDRPVASVQDDADGDDDDSTVAYDVDGDVEIVLEDVPEPGETVELEATIEDVPMADATVSVDGDDVAETDATGVAEIEIPDDGTDSVEVGVSRGEFHGTTAVDVALLEGALSPDGLAPIPGSPGVVEVTAADEPVANAAVEIDGETVGTTDENGTLAITLPVDPTATVTVSAGDQTATTSLADAYGNVALAATLVVVGLAALAYRTYGVFGAGAVLGGAGALLAVLVVEAFYGPAAGAAALLAAVGLAFAVAYMRRGRSVDVGRPSAGDAPNRFLEWFVDRVLTMVAVVERAIVALRAKLAALRSWLGTLPRSGTALVAAFVDWLSRVPDRAFGRLRGGLEAIRTLPVPVIVGLLAVGAGYAVDGQRGAAAAAGAFVLAALLYRYRRRRTASSSGDEPKPSIDRDGERAVGPAAAAETDDSDERLTFRELWRAFASRVAPGRWPRSTPGEIQRSAVEQGYPRGSVDELTTLFREVEYGRRPLSSGVRDRADAAYSTLVDEEEDDEDEEDADDGGEPSDESDGTSTDADATTDAGTDEDADADSSGDRR